MRTPIVYRIVKRALDLVVGVALVLVLSPIVLGLAVALGWRFRANPFFVQRRVGIHGRLIHFPKLRTLDPRSVPRYATKDQVDVEGEPGLPRILRKAKLDELPQLALVVTGRLTLVGPRPRMPGTFEQAETAYQVMREQVPQGCTGLWQISVHASELPAMHPEYDAFYVDHASMALDLWILWRTLRLALGGGAICLDDIPPRLLRGRHLTRGRAHATTSTAPAAQQ